MILDEKLSKKVTPHLFSGETVEWVGRPVRLPKFAKWFFSFFLIFPFGMVLEYIVVPAVKNSTVPIIPSNWDSKAIAFVALIFGGFIFLWRMQFLSNRYIVTNKRAFIFSRAAGQSWKWNSGSGWQQDYSDPEHDPVLGIPLKPSTCVMRPDIEGGSAIKIYNAGIESSGLIRTLIEILPKPVRFIFDHSVVHFICLENPDEAEANIAVIIERMKKRFK